MQTGGFTETKRDFWEVKNVSENISFFSSEEKKDTSLVVEESFSKLGVFELGFELTKKKTIWYMS